MGKLIRFGFLVLLAPLLFSFLREGVIFIASITDWAALTWCGLGLLVYGFLAMLLPRDLIMFVEILEHELAHAAMGVIMFKQVGGIAVSTKGAGVTSVVNPNAAIYLAPYFLPLFTLPLLVARPFVDASPNLVRLIDFMIGFTLSFHYLGLFTEFTPQQPDIAETGLLFSTGIAIVLNLVFLVITLCVILGSYSEIVDFFGKALATAPEYYRAVLAQVQRLF